MERLLSHRVIKVTVKVIAVVPNLADSVLAPIAAIINLIVVRNQMTVNLQNKN
jgi:hypothetical protein